MYSVCDDGILGRAGEEGHGADEPAPVQSEEHALLTICTSLFAKSGVLTTGRIIA
ncbi:MAG: hypothetical protein QXJ69_07565 [Desulfurococcaceae archaeon]